MIDTFGGRLARRLKAKTMRGTVRFLIVAATLIVCASAACASDSDWPMLHMPDGLTLFPIGRQVTVNGMSMRLAGFTSSESPAAVRSGLRRSLGAPLVESQTGARQVLGRADGNFYITVQLIAAGSGTRGTVAVTNLAAAPAARQAYRDATARWLDRLPAGSRIASDMSSEDGGKTAHHLVFANGASPARNRDALIALMAGDGYRVEREVGPDVEARKRLPVRFDDAVTVYFAGQDKEAIAVILRDDAGTAVVLNTTATLGAFR
jgi:hypothetical protein